MEQFQTNPTKTWPKVLADFAESQENLENVASQGSNGIAFEPWLG
jgi:hypothetical protein